MFVLMVVLDLEEAFSAETDKTICSSTLPPDAGYFRGARAVVSMTSNRMFNSQERVVQNLILIKIDFRF